MLILFFIYNILNSNLFIIENYKAIVTGQIFLQNHNREDVNGLRCQEMQSRQKCPIFFNGEKIINPLKMNLNTYSLYIVFGLKFCNGLST